MADELVQLATVYGSPGFLLLAFGAQGDPAGCVGVHSLVADGGRRTGEIRRMFVRPEYRSTGLGRALLADLLQRMADGGFDRAVLNTLPPMEAAIALYTNVGFELADPYVDEPLDGTLYFSLPIG